MNAARCLHPGPVRGAVRRTTVALAMLALVGLASALGAPAASAHTDLVGQSPAAGAVDRVPTRLDLTFATSILPDLAEVVVRDDDGTDHVVGRAGVLGEQLSVPLTGLGRGTYHVAYRVVASDGHPVVGGYSFTLARGAAAAGGDASAAAPVAAPPTRWLVPVLALLAAAVLVATRVRVAVREVRT